MSDRTIAAANDVYAFVAQLKTEAEKRGDPDLTGELVFEGDHSAPYRLRFC